MTHDFKLRNGHRTRALLHAVSLLNAQACKPYTSIALVFSATLFIAPTRSAPSPPSATKLSRSSLSAAWLKASELKIGALASHLLGYVEIAQNYRSVWGVWLDHCARPGFLTFQVPEGAKNRQPMAGEILSFKRVHEGVQGGSASFLPVATLA